MSRPDEEDETIGTAMEPPNESAAVAEIGLIGRIGPILLDHHKIEYDGRLFELGHFKAHQTFKRNGQYFYELVRHDGSSLEIPMNSHEDIAAFDTICKGHF